MSFTVEWDWPARKMLLERLPWPTSSDVAIAVHRFAATRAPQLPSGRHGLRVAGYEIALRVDRAARTVLVLYLYLRR